MAAQTKGSAFTGDDKVWNLAETRTPAFVCMTSHLMQFRVATQDFFRFKVGGGQVIPAFEEAILGMKVRPVSLCTCPSCNFTAVTVFVNLHLCTVPSRFTVVSASQTL